VDTVVNGGCIMAVAAALVCGAADSEAQTLTSLPQASVPLGATDACYVVQGGVSKQFACDALGSSLVTLQTVSSVFYCGPTVSGHAVSVGSGGCLVDIGALSAVLSGAVTGSGAVSSGVITIPTTLALQDGGVMYPLGDNSGTVAVGLYTAIGGFPWSSGNITSVYAAVGGSGASMTFGVYSAASAGAALSAVPGCSAITVSSGGAATPTTCTATPIARGGQVYFSVTSISSNGTMGFVEPGFNRTQL